MATTSCWFLVFVWVVRWLPVMLAGHEEQQGEGCPAKMCGNLNISHPFWLPDWEAGRSCGPFDFEVRCSNDSRIPLLRSSVHYGFEILDILYYERTLRVADVHKEKDLNVSDGCHVPRWNTSSKLAPPFKVNPSNLNLIFYNCTAAHRDTALAKMRCPNATNAFVRAGVPYDVTGTYAGYALQGCNATVVPVRGSSSGSANANNYQQLIEDGFLLTWGPPPPHARSKTIGKIINNTNQKLNIFSNIRSNRGGGGIKFATHGCT